MPPCWAGRSLAFNGTFARSNPTPGAPTGSTLGGAWWGEWRLEVLLQALPRFEEAPQKPPDAAAARYVFILYTPPPGIELKLPGRG